MVDNLRLYFSLLRFSLSPDAAVPTGIAGIDWRDLYEFAHKQALVGVFYNGIKRLPKESGIAPQLLMKWVMEAEALRRQNAVVDRVATQVSDYFEREGFECVVLKGQGNALMYPDPYMRTPGDVDLWVMPKHDAGGASAEDYTLRYARTHLHGSEYDYHHIHTAPVDGVAVEVHFRPAFRQNLINDARLQRWFAESIGKKQRASLASGHICMPTSDFNIVYQLCHLSTHFLQEGIGLRQLVDYYMLLHSERPHDGELSSLLHSFGLYRFAGAVMWVLGEVMSMPQSMMIAEPCERFGRMLLHDILTVGNLGQHDARVSSWRRSTQIGRNLQRFVRDVRLCSVYPTEALSEPIFRLYHFFWRLSHRG